MTAFPPTTLAAAPSQGDSTPATGAARGPLAAPPVPLPGESGRTRTILVVEDDPEVRALFVSFLAHAGYHVIESPNGADAMDLVSRHGLHIDLLLTDVVMPRAGGPTLAAALAVRQPSLKVIYISGFPPVADHPLGIVSIQLRKPVARSTLLEQVAALIGR